MTPHEFNELDSEKEEEEVRLRTDGEIVEDIRKETTWVNGETVNEDEGDGEDCNDDDEQITLAEMMDAVRATLPSALNVINASSVGKLVQLVTASRLTYITKNELIQ